MKKLHCRFINNKGSMTVEASLIFPIIFLAIILVIYICLLLYQQTYLKAIADHSVERGAACWNNISRMKIDAEGFRLKTGKLETSKELLDEVLYLSDNEQKINKLKIYTINELKKNNILKGEIFKSGINEIVNTQDKVDIWIKDYVLYKELNIDIKDSYKIPIGHSLKLFGINDRYDINVHSKAVINDPMDFIRNTDFIVDTLNENKVTSEYVSKFKETMNKIKDNIDEFFKE